MLGWEAALLFTASGKLNLLIDNVDANHFTFLIGIRYLTPFDFPLNLLIRTGIGASYTLISSTDVSRQTDIGGFTLEYVDSLDFNLRAGVGLRMTASPRFFIDLTLDAIGFFYYNHTTWFLQPRLEGGFRW